MPSQLKGGSWMTSRQTIKTNNASIHPKKLIIFSCFSNKPCPLGYQK